jgi:hypothetical protein
MAQVICKQEAPPLKQWLPGHWAACHFALDDAGESVPLRQESIQELKA